MSLCGGANIVNPEVPNKEELPLVFHIPDMDKKVKRSKDRWAK